MSKTALSAIFRRVSKTPAYTGASRSARKAAARYAAALQTRPDELFREPPVNLTGEALAFSDQIKGQDILNALVNGGASPSEIVRDLAKVWTFGSLTPPPVGTGEDQFCEIFPEAIYVANSPRGEEIGRYARQAGIIVEVIY